MVFFDNPDRIDTIEGANNEADRGSLSENPSEVQGEVEQAIAGEPAESVESSREGADSGTGKDQEVAPIPKQAEQSVIKQRSPTQPENDTKLKKERSAIDPENDTSIMCDHRLTTALNSNLSS
ncbi:MAG: hypothetical protein PF441_11960 [Desulfuromusa sp.]|jgi:hypothetical protein|nr:hypothetical protein [Desulfuromusa sp.]